MDYPFFAWRIGSIPLGVLDNIAEWCAGAGWHNASGFDPRHQLTQQISDTPGWSDIRATIEAELKHAIGDVNVVDVNINRLVPGAFIAEHTDTMSYGAEVNDYAWMPMMTHTIHIPIKTNAGAVSKHRRSRDHTLVRSTHLERGGIYLYNNVCWHSVHNQGDEVRTHFFIKVRDDERFSLKHRLLLDNSLCFNENRPANFPWQTEPFDPVNANTVVDEFLDKKLKEYQQQRRV